MLPIVNSDPCEGMTSQTTWSKWRSFLILEVSFYFPIHIRNQFCNGTSLQDLRFLWWKMLYKVSHYLRLLWWKMLYRVSHKMVTSCVELHGVELNCTHTYLVSTKWFKQNIPTSLIRKIILVHLFFLAVQGVLKIHI